MNSGIASATNSTIALPDSSLSFASVINSDFLSLRRLGLQ